MVQFMKGKGEKVKKFSSTSPDIEARIVSPECLEVLFVDGEETARHGGALDRLGGILRSLGWAEPVPGEDEVPVETSHRGQAKLRISELISDNKWLRQLS